MRRGATTGALLGALVAGACGEADPSPPVTAPVDLHWAAIVQRLDPLEGPDAEPVLAVQGIPIRRGDFRRLVDYLRTLGAPDLATRALREAALLQILLPRALHLVRADPSTVDAVIASLDAFRARRDLVAWTNGLQRVSTLPVDPQANQEIAPRAASPEIALALLSLAQAGQLAGPVWAREGVFAFELVRPAERPEDRHAERTVRTGGCFWVRGEAAVLREAMADLLARGAVVVLDPAFRSAVPERLP